MDSALDTLEVGRALKWARWLHWLLVGFITFLLLAILQLGARVQSQKGRDRRARQLVLVESARTLRLTRGPGWESAARERLEEARAIGGDVVLRDELAAWLTEAPAAEAVPIHHRLRPPAGSRLNRLAWSPASTHLGAAGGGSAWAWTVKPDGFGVPSGVPSDRIPPDRLEPDLVGPRVRLEPVSGPHLQLVGLPDGGPVVRLPLPGRGAALSVAVSPDGRWLAAVPGDGDGVEVWDLHALRAALRMWNMDWNDADPGGPAPPAAGPEVARNRVRVLSGLGLVLLVAGLAIASQYLLLRRYREAEQRAVVRSEELRRARESLAHADKMRALGTLAAGVAHDFNNLLSVIQMSRQLIERSDRPSPADREHLANIGQAVSQGRTVVRAILGYSRDPMARAEPLELPRFLPDLLTLLRHPFLDGLDVRLEVQPGLPAPVVRRGRLEQVLLNVLVNASESMHGRGILGLIARRATAPGECVLSPRGSGPWVEVEVTDTGPGIPPDVRSRMFEPFFTTKQSGAGRGTGLGLATVWRLAEEENYGLRVAYNLPSGTRFTVLVPVDGPGPVTSIA